MRLPRLSRALGVGPYFVLSFRTDFAALSLRGCAPVAGAGPAVPLRFQNLCRPSFAAMLSP